MARPGWVALATGHNFTDRKENSKKCTEILRNPKAKFNTKIRHINQINVTILIFRHFYATLLCNIV